MKDIDFTPKWYREAAQRRQARRRQIVWLSLLIAAMGTWTLAEEARLHMLRRNLAALEHNRTLQEPMIRQSTSLLVSLEEADARGVLHEKLASGLSLHTVLADLSQRLPSSVYLNEMTVDRPDRLQPANRTDSPETTINPPKRVAKLNVLLIGHAVEDADVGKLVNALSESELLEGIQLNYSRPDVVRGRKVRRFEIQCRLPQFN